MTKVSLAQKEIDDLQKEIKKLCLSNQNLEADIFVLESKLSDLKGINDENFRVIARRKGKLEQLKVKLEKIKTESKPLDGQLCFVNTGYKEVVQI